MYQNVLFYIKVLKNSQKHVFQFKLKREKLHLGIMQSKELLGHFLFRMEAGIQGSVTPSLCSYRTQTEPLSPIL